MSKIPWLEATAKPQSMPSPNSALDEPNGLLAAGGDLSPQWLIHAYTHGIFPWFDHNDPILWWSPNPRAVIFPDQLHISRSLRKTITRGHISMTADTCFNAVITGCAAPRPGSPGTWITPEMQAAYVRLHNMKIAHSFEAWQNGALVGGIYGLKIGGVFFGESMFSTVADASKVALASAAAYLQHIGIELIDCQVASPHLRRLGACDMPRPVFIDEVSRLCDTASHSERHHDELLTDSFNLFQASI